MRGLPSFGGKNVNTDDLCDDKFCVHAGCAGEQVDLCRMSSATTHARAKDYGLTATIFIFPPQFIDGRQLKFPSDDN